mgnify:FL=1
MVTIKGQGVCGGVAFGKLYVLKKTSNVIKRERVDDTEAELARFEDARKKTMLRLSALYDKAVAEVGESSAMIFEIHRMMLEDEDYISSIHSIITNQKLNAETAVANTSDNFAEIFTAMNDSYMQARAADVRDISERLIGVLSDSATDEIHSDIPVILAAEDLAPSETVQLDKSKIMAIVTEKGSANSHTAILARTLNIPAVIGAKGITDNGESTDDVIVDGFTGTVYISPDMNTVLAMQKKKDEADSKKKLLNKLKGVKPVTKDGQSILLYANIGNPGDLPQAYANDAQGVGLFRSEFIYLERNSYPTEDEQFAVYKKSAEKMGGKRIIIRTLDIGADKQADYFELPREENPAMGVRAIRICLTRPQLFKTQLRALYRASAYGNIAIMFPMITSVNEVKRIKEICSEVRDELKAEKIPFNENTPLGIMIETPAAALISDKLADEVDFFSIGTNDLTQYTLAVDRQNRAAEQFCDTHHLSVLRLIKTVVDNAHKGGIWAGICGELGADTSLTEMFLAMGVDELSVSPGAILPIKKKVLETDVSAVRDELLAKLN